MAAQRNGERRRVRRRAGLRKLARPHVRRRPPVSTPPGSRRAPRSRSSTPAPGPVASPPSRPSPSTSSSAARGPSPILAFHGTADPLVPYQDGASASRCRASRCGAPMLNMGDWARLDRCRATPGPPSGRQRRDAHCVAGLRGPGRGHALHRRGWRPLVAGRGPGQESDAHDPADQRHRAHARFLRPIPPSLTSTRTEPAGPLGCIDRRGRMTACRRANSRDATRHPWNQAFAWSLPDTCRARSAATERSTFDREGFLVLPGRDRPRHGGGADARSSTSSRPRSSSFSPPRRTAGSTSPRRAPSRSPSTPSCGPPRRGRFAKHPALVGLCQDLVGPDVNLYWDQAVYKKPDKPRRFPWHQDTGYTYVEPQHYLTCWIALTDVTIANGCPWVLPRVHRAGTLLHHWVDPIGWECLAADPYGRRRRRRCRPAARWCSPHSRRTSPDRTPPTRSARPTSSSTRPSGMRTDRGRLAARCGADRVRPRVTILDRQFAVLRDVGPGLTGRQPRRSSRSDPPRPERGWSRGTGSAPRLLVP